MASSFVKIFLSLFVLFWWQGIFAEEVQIGEFEEFTLYACKQFNNLLDEETCSKVEQFLSMPSSNAPGLRDLEGLKNLPAKEAFFEDFRIWLISRLEENQKHQLFITTCLSLKRSFGVELTLMRSNPLREACLDFNNNFDHESRALQDEMRQLRLRSANKIKVTLEDKDMLHRHDKRLVPPGELVGGLLDTMDPFSSLDEQLSAHPLHAAGFAKQDIENYIISSISDQNKYEQEAMQDIISTGLVKQTHSFKFKPFRQVYSGEDSGGDRCQNLYLQHKEELSSRIKNGVAEDTANREILMQMYNPLTAACIYKPGDLTPVRKSLSLRETIRSRIKMRKEQQKKIELENLLKLRRQYPAVASLADHHDELVGKLQSDHGLSRISGLNGSKDKATIDAFILAKSQYEAILSRRFNFNEKAKQDYIDHMDPKDFEEKIFQRLKKVNPTAAENYREKSRQNLEELPRLHRETEFNARRKVALDKNNEKIKKLNKYISDIKHYDHKQLESLFGNPSLLDSFLKDSGKNHNKLACRIAEQVYKDQEAVENLDLALDIGLAVLCVGTAGTVPPVGVMACGYEFFKLAYDTHGQYEDYLEAKKLREQGLLTKEDVANQKVEAFILASSPILGAAGGKLLGTLGDNIALPVIKKLGQNSGDSALVRASDRGWDEVLELSTKRASRKLNSLESVKVAQKFISKHYEKAKDKIAESNFLQDAVALFNRYNITDSQIRIVKKNPLLLEFVDVPNDFKNKFRRIYVKYLKSSVSKMLTRLDSIDDKIKAKLNPVEQAKDQIKRHHELFDPEEYINASAVDSVRLAVKERIILLGAIADANKIIYEDKVDKIPVKCSNHINAYQRVSYNTRQNASRLDRKIVTGFEKSNIDGTPIRDKYKFSNFRNEEDRRNMIVNEVFEIDPKKFSAVPSMSKILKKCPIL